MAYIDNPNNICWY